MVGIYLDVKCVWKKYKCKELISFNEINEIILPAHKTRTSGNIKMLSPMISIAGSFVNSAGDLYVNVRY